MPPVLTARRGPLAKPWKRPKQIGSTTPATPAAPATPNTPYPADGGTAVYSLMSWVSDRATKFDFYFGTSATPPLFISNYVGTSYVPTLTPGTTYYWKIVAKNDGGSATGPIWSFVVPDATDVLFEIDGALTTSRIRWRSLTIRDVIGAQPNTASLLFDTSAPTAGSAIKIGLGLLDSNTLIFAGHIQSVDQSYQEVPGNTIWPANLIDYTFEINRKRPFGNFVDMSASDVARTLLAQYAPGFTGDHVQDNLPEVTINFDGTQDFMTCLTDLAKVALCEPPKVDYGRDLHLFQSESVEPPDPLDEDHPPLNDPPMRFSSDLSQVRTRIYGKGHAESLAADCAVGEWILPLPNTADFTAGGGLAIASTTSDGAQTERLTYTDVIEGGGGALVGSGASPSSAPTALFQNGTGVDAGVHEYAITYVTASGESIAGPRKRVTVDAYFGDDGVDVHGPTSIGTFENDTVAHGAANPITGHTYRLVYTWIRSVDGTETLQSVSSNSVVSNGKFLRIAISGVEGGTTPPAGYSLLRFYIDDNGAGYKLFDGGGWATSGSYFVFAWDGALGAAPPSANNKVNLTAISTGSALVTSRKIYRTPSGSGQLKLLTTLADNTTTTYLDTAADSSLGANVPVTDTSGLTQPSGQVLAGSTSIPTSGVGSFASSGWLFAPGGQYVRYTRVGVNETIQLDAVSQLNYGGTLTFTHVCGTGSALFVFTRHDAGSITSVTYNGVAMTFLTSVAVAPGTYGMYYMASPASGSHTVQINGPANAAAAAASYIGIDASALINVSTTTTGTGAISTTLTSTVTDAMGLYFVADRSGISPTAGQNAFSRVTPGAGASMTLFDSGSPVNVAGAFTMGATASGSCGAIMAMIAPFYNSGRLAGIPASGAGSIQASISYNSTVTVAPALIGINHYNGLSKALAKGSKVNIFVQRDDTTAQTELAALEGGDGIREHMIVDERRNEESLNAVCDAELDRFKNPIIALTYCTRDTKTRAGKVVIVQATSATFDSSTFDPVTFDTTFDLLATYEGGFLIQDVTITFDAPGLNPRYTVTASSSNFTLADLLRRVQIN